MQTLAANACAILKSDGLPNGDHEILNAESFENTNPHLFALPTFDELFPAEDDDFQPLPKFSPSMDAPAVIIHSSG